MWQMLTAEAWDMVGTWSAHGRTAQQRARDGGGAGTAHCSSMLCAAGQFCWSVAHIRRRCAALCPLLSPLSLRQHYIGELPPVLLPCRYDSSNHDAFPVGDPSKRAFTYFVLTGGRFIGAAAVRLAVLKFVLSMTATKVRATHCLVRRPGSCSR